MRCEDFDELIHLFWDGRINEREREELEGHLSTCKRCKEKLALLESIEKGAKGIKIKEPSQEYWDAFSSRVRERIIAQKEASFSFKLKKALENIFTFSPLRVKIAAGVMSIVFVFIVGKLYFDYRGKEILPTTPRVERREKPAPHAPELKRETVPLEEGAKKKKAITPTDKSEIPAVPQVIPEEKTISVAPIEEKEEKKDEIGPPPEELKKSAAPQIVSEEKITPGIVEPKEEFLSTEAYSTGAGVEEKGKVLEQAAPPEPKAKEMDAVRAARKPPAVVFDRAIQAASEKEYYVINDKKLPKLKEEYIHLQEDILRETIKSWMVYIQENPKDSLANEGYLQVAIAYYLLSKLTQDESDIAQSIEVLEKYEKQVPDPKTKEELNKKLKQLRALKEK
ncbi:MAG: hypothetical protein AMJ73_10050 [candidate division Zixibacteria bacterium SM1_73]|nr:MAG: hypothetical protein AMJ73_10050 [candidate division Zixibacteria bacterium SM1_73]